jgi:hypothetical protein
MLIVRSNEPKYNVQKTPPSLICFLLVVHWPFLVNCPQTNQVARLIIRHAREKGRHLRASFEVKVDPPPTRRLYRFLLVKWLREFGAQLSMK